MEHLLILLQLLLQLLLLLLLLLLQLPPLQLLLLLPLLLMQMLHLHPLFLLHGLPWLFLFLVLMATQLERRLCCWRLGHQPLHTQWLWRWQYHHWWWRCTNGMVATWSGAFGARHRHTWL